MTRILTMAACALALAGCTPKPTEPPGPYTPPQPKTEGSAEAPAQNPQNYTGPRLFSAERDALEKAKGVNDMVQKEAEERKKAIDEQLR